MVRLEWVPTDEQVEAEVERQATLRAEIDLLDAEIKGLQARKVEVSGMLDRRDQWATDLSWWSVRRQAKVWRVAADSAHPLYLDGQNIKEARNGCLYDPGSRTCGHRYQRDGDRVLMAGRVVQPVTKMQAAEVAKKLRGILARLDGVADAT